MKHSIVLTMLAAFAFSSTGCGLMNTGKTAFVDSMRMFRPNPYDSPLRPEDLDEEDEWSVAGKEGRHGMERERDPDRWWQNYIMSPQARSIERNLGID
ncbi:MAG: hypothetical protein R3C59_11410 [Planctomycetaceae bacterium]